MLFNDTFFSPTVHYIILLFLDNFDVIPIVEIIIQDKGSDFLSLSHLIGEN